MKAPPGHPIGPRASLPRWSDVAASRDLLTFLAWRDVKVRYTQAALGVGWAVLQPLLMVLIFSVFFGRFAKLPSEGVPYSLFAFSGLVPWTFFSNSVGSATQSLVANSNLLTKVFFPRIVLPVAAILSWLPDLAIATVLVIFAAVLHGWAPTWTLLALPAVIVFIVFAASSVSIGLAALNVEFRDVRYAVPFLLQIWLFVTPVVYPTGIVPASYRWLLALNPMTGVVEGFRWCALGRRDVPLSAMTVSFVAALVMTGIGSTYFRRVERRFADVV